MRGNLKRGKIMLRAERNGLKASKMKRVLDTINENNQLHPLDVKSYVSSHPKKKRKGKKKTLRDGRFPDVDPSSLTL